MNREKNQIVDYFNLLFNNKPNNVDEFGEFHLSLSASNSFIGINYNNFKLILQYEKKIDSHISNFYIPYFTSIDVHNILLSNINFNNINRFFKKLNSELFKYDIFKENFINEIKKEDIYEYIDGSNTEFRFKLNFKQLKYNDNYFNITNKTANIKLKLVFKVYNNKISSFAIITIPFLKSRIEIEIPIDNNIEDYLIDSYINKFKRISKKNIADEISKNSKITSKQLLAAEDSVFFESLQIHKLINY